MNENTPSENQTVKNARLAKRLFELKNDLHQLLEQKEDLNPELAAYKEQVAGFICIRHPLFYEMIYVEQMNGYYNASFEIKKKMLERYHQEQNWSCVVFTHERPYRLNAFVEIVDKINDPKVYWKLLGEIWVDSENIWQNIKAWRKLLSVKTPDRNYMMDELELEEYNKLPDKVLAFRGCQIGKNKNGLSWTLDKDVANMFAKRFRQNGEVISQEFNKNRIVALFHGRKEKELVII